MTDSVRERALRPWVVGLVALVLTAGLVGRALSGLNQNATAFVGFGTGGPIGSYAEERLGDVYYRGVLGHDGKFFFVQANDPWLLDPLNNAEILDFPVYRSQRMLYPLLAGGLGLFEPEAVVWGLLIVNVIAMAVGTWGAARLAQHLGGSPWWGLAFPANLGLLYALTIDSSGVVAAALAIWAVALLYEDRFAPAVALLAASTLTREVMVLCAVGVGVWLWTQHRKRQALFAVGIPALALGIWEVYLTVRLGSDVGSTRNIGLPFVGLARSIPEWLDDPITLVTGACVLAFLLLYVVKWWKTRSLLGWAFLGFVPLALMMTDKVWLLIFDFTRALAPLMTATILLVYVQRVNANDQPAADLPAAAHGAGS